MEVQVTPRDGNYELRSPELDLLREACAAAAARLSGAFGIAPTTAVTDWRYFRSTWKVSWAWLIPGATKRDAAKLAGFRVRFDGRATTVETWGLYQASFTAQGALPAGVLNRLLDLSFGVARGHRYQGEGDAGA